MTSYNTNAPVTTYHLLAAYAAFLFGFTMSEVADKVGCQVSVLEAAWAANGFNEGTILTGDSSTWADEAAEMGL